jgi:excisionase family DNA binding protein
LRSDNRKTSEIDCAAQSKERLLNKHHSTAKRRHRQPVTPDARYHSGSEFARRLGVSRTTIWRMMRAGRLRFIRISPSLVRIPSPNTSAWATSIAASHQRVNGDDRAGTLQPAR